MAQMIRGFYLSPTLYVNSRGEIFQAPIDNGLSGFNWEKIGDFFKPIIGGVADRIKNGGNNSGGNVPQYPIVPVQQSSGFQMDTTTMLLLGGAVLLFMSQPRGK